jgi:hypothetical protein
MRENPIGEVVESSTATFVAQCLEVPRQDRPRLFDPPVFGSFVKVARGGPASAQTSAALPEADEADPFAEPPSAQDLQFQPAIYGLVFSACTTSLESNRRPSALGLADEDEIARTQPQIFELLRTEFSALSIAYSSEGEKGLRRHIPPIPPRIHARVYSCDEKEVRALVEDLSFLRGILLSNSTMLNGVPSDELAAACLRESRRAAGDDNRFLLQAGKTLAAILIDDYERLQSILRNVI